MTGVTKDPQAALDEVVVDDPELTRLVILWAGLKGQKKALTKEIKELDVDGAREKVTGKLEYDEQVGGRFRIGDTGYIVEVKPAGESKDINFTTTPRIQFKLVNPSEGE